MFKPTQIEKNPNFLEHLMVFLGIVLTIIIISLTAFITYEGAKDDVLRIAEHNAKQIGKLLVEKQKQYFFSGKGKSISLNNEERQKLEQETNTFLKYFDIARIKIFNLDQTIIYSNEKNIIGIKDNKNAELKKALGGDTISTIEAKEELTDLSQEKRFDVDVVETYIPVFDNDGNVAGAIETYIDITRYRKDISEQVASATISMSLILIIIFSISYIIVHLSVKEIKKLLNRLYTMARTDSMTGFFNRRALDERGKEELSMMKRQIHEGKTVRVLGIIMLDIDHFKNVNDTYGHDAGDEVLLELSERIKSCMRGYDIIGRYGGEEFLILLPDTNKEETIATAERLRKVFMERSFDLKKKKLNITASFGVTCCYDPEEGLDAAVKRADEALYKAKEKGRNCVISQQ